MMFVPRDFPPIKYVTRRIFERDFRLTILGVLVLAAALAGAVAAAVAGPAALDPVAGGGVFIGGMIAGLLLFLLPFWMLDIAFIVTAAITFARLLEESFLVPFLILAAGLLLLPMLQLSRQWEKVVIFRLGRFRGLRGPGVFLIVPVIDRAARFIDTRIRVVEFRHETTLTRDTVPVSVDAIAFWMIWDAEKATLEVEDYLDAVTLAAHAARASVASAPLSKIAPGDFVAQVFQVRVPGKGHDNSAGSRIGRP